MDRLKFVQGIIYFVALAVVLRLAYWQFIADVKSAPSVVPQETRVPAARGDLYTADMFPIVANQEAFTLYARPQEVTADKKIVAEKIAPYLISEKYATQEAQLPDDQKKQKEEEIKKEEEQVVQKLSDKKLFWVQLARKVTKQTKEKLENLELTGIGFHDDSKRVYPEASMAAHILGFVGSNDFGEDTGYFGLEGYYDSRLKGKDGRAGEVKDPFGLPILVSKFKPIQPKKGSSLYLSIDRTVQFIVEDKLRTAVEKYGAKEGSVIISDVKTGKILSMASYPTYNPNLYQEFSQDSYRNPAVADTYEPGSTFKIVTMASALDAGVVEPSTKCTVCDGPRPIGGYDISTWNKKYYPNSTMTEVIQHSDNVGMTFVAEKLGLDKFMDYIDKFGFGKKTKIDLQEEGTGVIRPKEEWRDIDLATASFGQGIAVTPLQMIQAVQSIANGGKQISPKIVDKILSDGKEQNLSESKSEQVISLRAATQMTEMMVNAVEQGEAKAFVPKGYRIAGKTGTAQIPVAGHYDPNKTIASFIGFAPADKPKFVMLVRFTEPTSSIFGSETAAPTFFAIAKELFNYWGISPSKQ